MLNRENKKWKKKNEDLQFKYNKKWAEAFNYERLLNDLKEENKKLQDELEAMKEQAVRDHNKPMKMESKLLLNGVYGKFAERFHDMKDVIYFDDKGFPHYEEVPNEKEYELGYIDTDSIHCNYWGKYETQLKKYASMIREGKEVDSKKLDKIFANVCKELRIDYDEARHNAHSLDVENKQLKKDLQDMKSKIQDYECKLKKFL